MERIRSTGLTLVESSSICPTQQVHFLSIMASQSQVSVHSFNKYVLCVAGTVLDAEFDQNDPRLHGV